MRYVEMEKVEPGMVLGNDLFDMEGNDTENRYIIPVNVEGELCR